MRGESSHFPVAKEGWTYIAPLAALTAILWIFQEPRGGGLLTFLTLFVVYFFRDPERPTPPNEKAILSPADGKIVQLEPCREEQFLKGPAMKVSIFMSLFDVHVNRIPLSGRIVEQAHRAGKFLRADLSQASFQNEQNALLLETDDRVRLLFVQVAGIIARRIVCRVKVGDRVLRGQRFGLIHFGSRLDIYLPPQTQIRVQLGQKVFGGTSVIGILP
jgi:phosphatidylserine decarboxylase